ncbi:MAG: hypothetical protein WDZ91_11670 [Paenibacillaceae bacterium]
MTIEQKFTSIFTKLVKILEVYESQMDLKVNTDDQYSLDTLMPVYAYPQLLAGISEPLKKRMQGKSCFNFKQEDDLFRELTVLTEKGYTKYKEEDLI